MEPCPKCGQQVLQMATTCRHCGHEIDEATFFLNEGDMVAEIMALKKEAEEKAQAAVSLRKSLKIKAVTAALAFVAGGALVAFSGQHLLEALGALSCIAGVVFTVLAGLTQRRLTAMDE